MSMDNEDENSEELITDPFEFPQATDQVEIIEKSEGATKSITLVEG